MREALLDALEADVLYETADNDEGKAFYKVLKDKGLTAAKEWRKELINKTSS